MRAYGKLYGVTIPKLFWQTQTIHKQTSHNQSQPFRNRLNGANDLNDRDIAREGY